MAKIKVQYGSSQKAKDKGIEVGADDFLTKPIDQRELLVRVKSLLRMKYLHDRLQQSYEDLRRLEQFKEDLAKMVVHDIRNILLGIHVGLELMASEDKQLNPEQRVGGTSFFGKSLFR